MRFGVQVSVAKGPLRTAEFARERGCECVQIFSSNPRGWALSNVGPDTDHILRQAFERDDIRPVLLHTPYLVNIAARDPAIYAKSVASLVHAADRARRFDGYVIVHAGRDASGPRQEALERAAAAVLTSRKLVPHGRILVELTAGGRGSVASTVGEAAELLAVVDDDRIGICVDTCHAHAAGYDLSGGGLVDELDRLIGIERVGAIHCNDSRDPRGSARDRHWHLGQGQIGEDGLRAVLADPRLAAKPVVCETPGTADDDRANIARARELASPRARSATARPRSSRERAAPARTDRSTAR